VRHAQSEMSGNLVSRGIVRLDRLSRAVLFDCQLRRTAL